MALPPNWKTTFAGLGSIASAVAIIAKGISTSDYSDIGTAVPLIMTGIGLIVAQDAAPAVKK